MTTKKLRYFNHLQLDKTLEIQRTRRNQQLSHALESLLYSPKMKLSLTWKTTQPYLRLKSVEKHSLTPKSSFCCFYSHGTTEMIILVSFAIRQRHNVGLETKTMVVLVQGIRDRTDFMTQITKHTTMETTLYAVTNQLLFNGKGGALEHQRKILDRGCMFSSLPFCLSLQGYTVGVLCVYHMLL